MNKYIKLGIAVVILAVVAFVGVTYPKQNQNVGSVSSGQGVTNSTAKVAQQSLTIGTTTSYAQYNSGSTDRTIRSFDMQISTAQSTTTSYTTTCGTSTNATSIQGNLILNNTLTALGNVYGTTTGTGLYIASSSPGITGTTTTSVVSPTFANPLARQWTVGSYLVCQTTTADGYNSFNSGTTGFISFPYYQN